MKILTKATDIAKALNFGKYPVLIMNMDTQKGSKAVVIKKSAMYGDMRYKCTFDMGYTTADDGVLYLSTECAMMKDSYNYLDHLECAEYATAPIISADQIVAVYMYSPKEKKGFVRMMKSGRIDAMCITATKFSDLE